MLWRCFALHSSADILRQRTEDVDVKKYFLQCLQKVMRHIVPFSLGIYPRMYVCVCLWGRGGGGGGGGGGHRFVVSSLLPHFVVLQAGSLEYTRKKLVELEKRCVLRGRGRREWEVGRS